MIIYEPPFNIEIKECGVWESVDLTNNLLDALYIASSHVNSIREEYVRIIDNNNKII
jgi:hypothetical protein